MCMLKWNSTKLNSKFKITNCNTGSYHTQFFYRSTKTENVITQYGSLQAQIGIKIPKWKPFRVYIRWNLIVTTARYPPICLHDSHLSRRNNIRTCFWKTCVSDIRVSVTNRDFYILTKVLITGTYSGAQNMHSLGNRGDLKPVGHPDLPCTCPAWQFLNQCSNLTQLYNCHIIYYVISQGKQTTILAR